MTLIVVLGAILWVLGGRMGASKQAQIMVLSLLLAPVLLIQITLPVESTLRQATGGSLSSWLILLAGGALIWGYTFVLKRLKSKVVVPEEPVSSGPFTASELDRYARHIVLREIGGAGQQRLKAAKVLVIGAGGLGSPAMLYLAAAGVGTIGVIDDDAVSLSNLQRQVLHTDGRIDMPKVFSAKEGLNAINPHVNILPFNRRLTDKNAKDLIANFDLILDGSDNFETRYLVNETCVALDIPLISAAISQWEGQISLYDPARGTPCYACIFPNAPAEGLAPSCAEAGVMGALPGVMGAMMASETIKHVTGAGQTLRGEMLIYDGLYGENRKMKLQQRADCSICGAAHSN